MSTFGTTTALSGRTAVVTGANSGIGQALAAALAARGAHVVLAVRDPAKGERAAAAIKASTAGRTTTARTGAGGGAAATTEVMRLDLADLASVHRFTQSWGDRPLHLLVNNAGVSTPTLQRNAAGRELQFATNHLGPFALTNLLLPHITGRVVTLASMAERQARLDLQDLDWTTRPYKESTAYANTKQANLLFTTGLQDRLTAAQSPVKALAAHPGLVATAMTGQTTGLTKLVVRLLAQSPQDGALPALLACTGDLPGDTFTGPEHLVHMRGGAQVIKRSKTSRDPRLVDGLWAASENLTDVRFPLQTTGRPPGDGS